MTIKREPRCKMRETWRLGEGGPVIRYYPAIKGYQKMKPRYKVERRELVVIF